jgi:dTDP-4-dehydrorhamnose reductase
MSLRIVVTGAGGQLGKVLVRDLQKVHEVFGLTRETLDIADRAATFERVVKLRPGVILNCAAWNDVDGAEDDPRKALATNGFGVGALADAAAACDAVFVPSR